MAVDIEGKRMLCLGLMPNDLFSISNDLVKNNVTLEWGMQMQYGL